MGVEEGVERTPDKNQEAIPAAREWLKMRFIFSAPYSCHASASAAFQNARHRSVAMSTPYISWINFIISQIIYQICGYDTVLCAAVCDTVSLLYLL